MSKKLGIPAISTGDIIRAEVKADTPMGRRLKEITNSGQLVPDAVVTAMVKERLQQPDAQRGYILVRCSERQRCGAGGVGVCVCTSRTRGCGFRRARGSAIGGAHRRDSRACRVGHSFHADGPQRCRVALVPMPSLRLRAPCADTLNERGPAS